LKRIELTAPAGVDEEQKFRDETEAKLLEAAKRVLPRRIPFDADFFTDLAAIRCSRSLVGAVRETPSLARDAAGPLHASHAARARGASSGKANSTLRRRISPSPAALAAPFSLRLAQAIALPFILSIVTAQWLGVFISYQLITTRRDTLRSRSRACVYLCVNLATVAISIIGKWLSSAAQSRPLSTLGVYYYRWWLAQRLIGLTHAKWFQCRR